MNGVLSQVKVRLVVALALAITAATWMPLVSGDSWLRAAAMSITACAALACGAAVLSRREGVGSLTATVAAVLLLTRLTLADTAIAGFLPTPNTVSQAWQLWQSGMTEINKAPAPITPSQSVWFVLVVALVWLWLSADVLSGPGGHPALACLPLLAMCCVPAAILPSGMGAFAFLTVAGCALAILAVGQRDLLTGRSRFIDAPRRSRFYGIAASLGIGAIICALLLPATLPNLTGGLIGRVSGSGGFGGGGSGSLDLNLNLRNDLENQSDDPLVEFSTDNPAPGPLRVFPLTPTNVDQWSADLERTLVRGLSGDELQTQLPRPTNSSDAQAFRYQIRIQGMKQQALPLPAPLASITGFRGLPADQVEGYAERTGTITLKTNTNDDVGYVANAPDWIPNNAALERAAGEQIPESLAPWLSMPAGTPEVLTRTAASVSGNGTPYVKAERLQEYFRTTGGFSYTLDVNNELQDGMSSFMSTFLAQKRGYCVHFATAMTLMARAQGIPARVVIGLLPGQFADGKYLVRARDAHAWPELWFPSVGWVRFEPTPSSRTGVAPSWTQRSVDAAPTPSASSSASATPSASPSTSAARGPRPDASDQTSTSNAQSNPVVSFLRRVPIAVWWLLGLLLLAAALPRAVGFVVARRRWSAARTAAELDEVAWAELVGRLSDLGGTYPSSLTVRQQRAQIAELLPAHDGQVALQRRADAVEQSRYVAVLEAPVTREDITQARSDVSTVAGLIGERTDRRTRLLAAWFPRWFVRR